MRARYPDHEGFVERDGVKVAYEIYGDGGPAVFLVPRRTDHPCPIVEGADPVPVPPPHRRHDRRAGHRPV